MKAREFCFSLITIVTFFCSFDLSQAEEQVNLEAMRIGDPNLEVSSLELILDPLTAEELEVITVSWRDSLKQTIQQLSEFGLKAGELSEDDKKTTFSYFQPALLKSNHAKFQLNCHSPSQAKTPAKPN